MVRDNPGVLALTVLIASLALADSVNPMTIVAAVYLAATEDPHPRLLGFVLGVFAVYLTGGLLMVLGPGTVLRGIASGSHGLTVHIASVVIGGVIVMLTGVMWRQRRQLAPPRLPARMRTGGRSGMVLGALMTLVDLPTAFPYFAAIGAIVGGDAALAPQIGLLVMSNVVYVLALRPC